MLLLHCKDSSYDGPRLAQIRQLDFCRGCNCGRCATKAPDVIAVIPGPAPARPPTAQSITSQTPPRVDLKALHERTSRDGKLTEAWITCKIEVAKGLARKTTEPTETILQASFGACSRAEEALRLSFAEGRMPPAAIDDILTRARQKSREQLSVIILAIRQGVPPDEPLPIRTPVSQ
jgi:hypothetical protein